MIYRIRKVTLPTHHTVFKIDKKTWRGWVKQRRWSLGFSDWHHVDWWHSEQDATAWIDTEKRPRSEVVREKA